MNILGKEIDKSIILRVFAVTVLILFVLELILPYIVQYGFKLPFTDSNVPIAPITIEGTGTVNLTVVGYEPALFLPVEKYPEFKAISNQLANAWDIEYTVAGDDKYYVISVKPGSVNRVYDELKQHNITLLAHMLVKFPDTIAFTVGDVDYTADFPNGQYNIGGEAEPIYQKGDVLTASVGVGVIDLNVVSIPYLRILPANVALSGTGTVQRVLYRKYFMNVSWESRSLDFEKVKGELAALNLSNVTNITYGMKSYALYNGTPQMAAGIKALGLPFIDYADQSTLSVPTSFTARDVLTHAIANITASQLDFPDSRIALIAKDGPESAPANLQKLESYAAAMGAKPPVAKTIALVNLSSATDETGNAFSYDQPLLFFEMGTNVQENDSVNLTMEGLATGTKIISFTKIDLAN
ncbi:TPA: hypothetical protein HA316_04865 [Candidatus Micrarchaeota archaeon]|nr:hypothetical protein [Candidatus Micrarchaeota archaeon]